MIERYSTAALPPATFSAIITLCDTAFQEETGPYFGSIGPGEHLLIQQGPMLVAHLMWVPRWLQPAGREPLHTAYIEMVATDGSSRGRGHATRLLEATPALLGEFDLAALSPATENLYRRLGWNYWRGPLSHRRGAALRRDPEDRVMILPLPRTPLDLDLDQPLSVEWRPGEVW